MEINKYSFLPLIREIVIDLSCDNYEKIQQNRRNGRVDIRDLQRVIEEYGCTIVPLPDNIADFIDAYTIGSEDRLDMYIPLWTKEEKRSDLTLFVSGYRKSNELVIEINDLRVL
jgi:hypothetical protein